MLTLPLDSERTAAMTIKTEPHRTFSGPSAVLQTSGDARSTVRRFQVMLGNREWEFHFDPIYSEALEDSSGRLAQEFLRKLEPLVTAGVRGVFRYPVNYKSVP